LGPGVSESECSPCYCEMTVENCSSLAQSTKDRRPEPSPCYRATDESAGDAAAANEFSSHGIDEQKA